MFVIADQNLEADLIADYIKQKNDSDGHSYGDESDGEQVVTIHEGKKSHLSEDDYDKLRTRYSPVMISTTPPKLLSRY